MRTILSITLFVIFTSPIMAQSLHGITNKVDTSYTTFKAYSDIKKASPNTKIDWVLDNKSASVAEERGIAYASIGNRALKLDVFSPTQKSSKNRPAIIIIHGGGWRTGNRTQHIPLAQHLAKLGYVCFTPEYRLSTEALYPAGVHDLKAAIRWVRANAQKYQLDSTKIATVGFSAGGQLSALLGCTGNNPKLEGNIGTLGHSSKVNAIVDIDGILAFIHPESGEGDDSKRTSAATYWFGYSKTERPDIWQEASALTYANAKTPPTLFLNSREDRMHAGRSDYLKILDNHNIYSEVHNFPDAPHSFCLFQPWFEPTVKYIDEFLGKIFEKK
jgi:pectinesterase